MADIFLSYASEDRERIEPLARALAAAGYSVWWDRDILAGADFSTEIEREIAGAKVVIAAWSEAAAASKWVRDEAAYARDKGNLAPIRLSACEPPLGFRQIQTIDFSQWSGADDTPATKSLLAAIARFAAATAAAPAPAAAPAKPRRPFLVLAVAATLAVGGVLAYFALDRRAAPPADEIAAKAAPAVEALAASKRPEEREAYKSFVAGDQKEALGILEALARDLEAKGEKKAAAEAYTRVGALALIIDPARGLAARRKAFELEPEAMEVFQGLFFDTANMKGWDAAMAFGEEAAAVPGISERARAFAYAHVAILAIDAGRGADVARAYLKRAETIRRATGDREVELLELWVGCFIDWRQDLLDESAAKIETGKRLARELGLANGLPHTQFDVQPAMLELSRGDWRGALAVGSAALTERKKKGWFLPWPLFNATCFSGLFAGEVDAAAPYCEAAANFADEHGGAWPKYMSAQLAAARGDFAEARAELAASRALAPTVPPIEAGRLRVEAQIAAAEGDFDAAQALIWRHIDLVAKDPAARSARATALRLFSVWAIQGGASERACDPLTEAKALYEEIGGKAGADAVAALAASAKCGA